MDTIQALQARREAIVTEFGSMRFIRGTVNEQYLKVAHKGKKEPVLRVLITWSRAGNRARPWGGA